jgi:PKD repeat protein
MIFCICENPTHRYNQGGVYDVSLEVRSEYGCIDSLTKEEFLEIFPQPYANFSASPELLEF